MSYTKYSVGRINKLRKTISMPQDIKVIAPAVVLIIVVAIAGAYALNKKSTSQTNDLASSQLMTETKDMVVSTPSYDQIVNDISADTNAEEAEAETDIDSAVNAEAGTDDSIINATGKENYESKF
jgi:hypothetical protein